MITSPSRFNLPRLSCPRPGFTVRPAKLIPLWTNPMIAGLPSSEIAWLALALLAGGLVTGFLSGLLGIGGGGIIVPVLYEVFRISGVSDSIRMQACVATSLAIIIPTSIRSAHSHWRHGAVDFSVIRRLGPWIVLGAVLGVL